MTPREITFVDRIAARDYEELVRRHGRQSQPVILTDAVNDWPALSRWSLDQLEARFGERIVTVGETQQGRLVIEREGGVLQHEMTFGEFIERLRGGDPGYYLLSPIEQLPELLDDIRFDSLAPHASWRSARVWMSAEGTVSALHQDLTDNFLVQVMGKKRVILIHPRDKPNVYRNGPTHGAPNFCAVDAENPDFERHPRFRDVESVTVEIGVGEALYIPRRWFHHVRSLERSISVNEWCASGPLALVARGAQLVARLRGLRP